MSLSVEHRFDVEQWDIGNAFLKGFSFKVMREMCQRFGITVPDVERQVLITVPGGVWYYLHEEGFYLDTPYRTGQYVLGFLKAMYGMAAWASDSGDWFAAAAAALEED